MQTNEIRVARQGSVATIWLDRPAKRNAMAQVCQALKPLVDAAPPNIFGSDPEDALQLAELARRLKSLPSRVLQNCIRLLTGSSADFLDDYFESDILKGWLASSSIIGSKVGPRSQGSGLVLLFHNLGEHDGHFGSWAFHKGGNGGFTQVLARAAQAFGAEIVVDAPVSHVTADVARDRIAATTGENHRMHKIDSTLRGNWASELQALVDGGRRVVLIPSHPRAGRICRGGMVYVNGVPVADSELGNDPRLPVRSSRPSDALDGRELADVGQLRDWLARGERGAAIVDAAMLDEIAELATVALSAPDVVVGGPASVVGAVADICAPVGAVPTFPAPLLPRPLVVVCASLHSVSREQIARMSGSLSSCSPFGRA